MRIFFYVGKVKDMSTFWSHTEECPAGVNVIVETKNGAVRWAGAIFKNNMEYIYKRRIYRRDVEL